MIFSRCLRSLGSTAFLSCVLSGAGPAATDAELGKQIFFDASLSSSGKVSCASCHDPRYAYGPPNAREVQSGGADLRRSGTRAAPSLRYTLRRTPIWSNEYQADPIEKMLEPDSAPSGGFDWDGRFDTLHAQAEAAFLSPNQMANPSRAAFVAKLRQTPYAAELRAAYGAGVFDDAGRAFALAARAVERFELDDASFYPYTSRFDEYLDGKAALDAREEHGRQLFLAPDKGNCAACHLAVVGADGSHPLFTDFNFQTLGVPRNARIPVNTRAAYFDLGLCGPQRTDQRGNTVYCGMFKTPTLRNVATRRVFFHNGAIHDLRDAVRFYVTRDSDAAHWYPHGADPALRYDDLPAALRRNVDHRNAPFNRPARAPPVLSDADIDDVVAFLGTLTDRDAATPPAATAAVRRP
jgi:cytochrome c peroxidase